MRSPEPATVRRPLTALVALLLAGLGASAAAQEIDYDTRRSAELRRCDEPRERGRVDEARRCFQGLLARGDALTRAESQWALGDLRAANDAFREAVAADPRAVLPRIRWARLFLASHQQDEAVRLLGEALEIAPEDVGARLALARVGAERFEGETEKTIAELRDKDPALIEAQLVAARLAIEDGRSEDAVRAATAALDQARRQQRAPLEAWTLLAAAELVNERDPARWTREALQYNPRYGRIYEELGYFETIRRRYREASVWLGQAVKLQPDLWSAHESLGVNQLRLGDREGAQRHLQAAYSGDPFSATTVNTLRLLDSLAQFRLERVDDPAMLLQLHQSEAAALRPYVEQLTRESIAAFSRRWGYTPTQPVIVELYPNHDDFAVRTAGLPGIGLLGVTFGHVVAMDSPSSRRGGDFHWGSTLWHEMAHVFTLSATDHRVPRWVSEGISVFEEWRTGPTPGIAVTPSMLDAFKAGKFQAITRLDEGFMRPSYEGQINVAYQQAGLTCLFIEERWGFPALADFLKAFKQPVTVEAAVTRVLKLPPEQFDRDFKAFMEKRFAPYLADTTRWPRLMGEAAKRLEAKDWKAAATAAREAVRLLPEFTTGNSAWQMLAQAQEGSGDRAGALETLLGWRKAGGWEPDGLRRLADLLAEAKREAEATEVLAALNYVDPLAAPTHARLGERYLAAGRGADALREFRVLLALDPLDTATANFGLARAHRLAGDLTLTRRHLLEALETAPQYRPAQKLLLDIIGDRQP
jgi:tetratricopeptide (TPR) repeat protein